MKKLIRILLLLFVIGGLVYANGIKSNFAYGTIRKSGNLIIDFHVRTGKPIFAIKNMKPGDSRNRNIDVTNGGNVTRVIVVRGVRKGRMGPDPKIETVLEIVIKDGETILYGPKKLSEFFNDSQDQNRVQLSNINSLEHKTYDFEVRFPVFYGNEFQKKSVQFDLIFAAASPR